MYRIFCVVGLLFLSDSLNGMDSSPQFNFQCVSNAQAFAALKTRNHLLFTQAIQKGADVNACNQFGTPLLSQAIMSQDLESMILLLENKANVNFAGNSSTKNTPLHWAVIQNNPILVRILLEYKACLFQKNGEGQTPFDIAVTLKRENLFAQHPLLFSHSIDWACQLYKAVINACINGNHLVFRTIINNYPDIVNIADSNSNTFLHLAASYGRGDVIKEILKLSPKIITNKIGQTALDVALGCNKFEAAELILEHFYCLTH
ncbi:MAG TPA: ankyrin repeat domain-containing protein [Candidatus Babeliaceae bacterium]|nr:ankyrin repeat domain-containing protein [Candidatus Babeliaceae bacterium]